MSDRSGGLRDWRRTAVLFVCYSFFSGFFNHLSGFHPAVRVIKYALLLALLVQFVVARRLAGEPLLPIQLGPRKAAALIAAVALLALAQLANPQWSSLGAGMLAGAISLLVHILPMGLFCVAYQLADERKTIRRWLGLLAGLSVLLATAALAQHYLLGPEALARLAPSYQETLLRESISVRTLEKRVTIFRPIGLASDAGTAAYHSALGFLICTLLIGLTADQQRRCRLACYAGLVLISLALVLSYVRTTFVMAIVGGLGLTLLFRRARVLAPLAILGLAFCLLQFSEKPFLTYRYRVLLRPIWAVKTHRGVALEMTSHHLAQHPLGQGLGRAGPVPYYRSPLSDRRAGTAMDNYYDAVLLEMGLPGLLLLGALFAQLLWHGLWLTRPPPGDPCTRTLSRGIVILLGVILFSGLSGQVLYTPPGSFLFWFLAGLMCSLERLE